MTDTAKLLADALQEANAALQAHEKDCGLCRQTVRRIGAALAQYDAQAGEAGGKGDALMALTAKWRDEAALGGSSRYNVGITRALLMCAKQLEAALAAAPCVRPPQPTDAQSFDPGMG